MTHVSDVPVALVVQLFDVVDRMPPTPELRVMAGISIPVMKIAPKESSAPIKVELAIKTFGLDNSESGEGRSEEHTSELQSLMRISYAVFCLKKKTTNNHKRKYNITKQRRNN